ncbi:MAG: OmpA family protein [Anaerolineales bacterium]|nr:OmpA family protein [Anaerolineales bacterium]
MKLVRTVGALGLVGFAVVSGQAAVAAESGWYGGISIGQSRAGIHHERIAAQLGVPVTSISFDDDDSDVGFKLLAGRKFNRNFAVEGGYFNLGKFGFTANYPTANSFTGDIKLQGLNLDAVGILPFTEKFSAFGRVGLIYTKGKDRFTGTGAGAAVAAFDPNPKKNDANYKYGVGLQYDFTRALGMRAEWERYRVNDAVGNKGDVDMLLVGLVYTFGTSEPAPRAVTPPPYVAPVAAAPAPAPKPVLVIVPIVAKTQQYCSILDIQFEINKSTVQREAEEKLDVLVTFMRKYPNTTAVIEGHTDEVGTSADNMRLSQSRADSMVNYVASRGIARSRLQAVGYGETRPIADNQTQIGKRLNRRINAIIACATDIEGIAPIPARIAMAMELEFDARSAAVRPQYREELRKVANFMQANPRVTATVEGHTGDLQATAALAMEISQRRAQNVVNYLVTEFGVARSRLAAEGFGQTRRFAYNTNLEGQQDNRRVNIIFDFPN